MKTNKYSCILFMFVILGFGLTIITTNSVPLLYLLGSNILYLLIEIANMIHKLTKEKVNLGEDCNET
ncbi:hypothetical protein J31TS2_20410 [Bacillus licheniformis]|nr:hypothetical protein BFP47_11830 [Bacillus licheniformis]OJT69969.1 hypothetical protein BFP46_05060 [Bacillus licheniformis]GIN25461.1 hypothetical protein J31TS2_20410 [Bacillus licheniformis]GIN29800.1 hypothetical protein J2TS5_18390 [Bacillus licheniformis]